MLTSQSIVLTDLSEGPHVLEVIGKNDAGMYQNDPDYGPNAVIARAEWTVESALSPAHFTSVERVGSDVVLRFTATANAAYTVEFAEQLGPAAAWQTVTNVPASAVETEHSLNEPASASSRFYRLVRRP
jgi:hypothetical protein